VSKEVCAWKTAISQAGLGPSQRPVKGDFQDNVPLPAAIMGIFRTLKCHLYALCTALDLHCTALHCSTWHCTALHDTALLYMALHYTALHCTGLLYMALHCTDLHGTALIYMALP
jgi:hypothetical protein